MKSSLNRFVCFFLFLIAFSACSTSGSQVTSEGLEGMGEPISIEEISACFISSSASNLPFLYADEKGLFKKYGLNVTFTGVDSGSKIATGLISGEFSFCQVGAAAVTNAVIAGEDTVNIAEYFNRYVFSLMVSPDIKTPADLKGKSVVVSEPGGSTVYAMLTALESFGLIPDEDVTLVNISGITNRMAALEAGRVSGGVFVPPFTLTLKEKGYYELLDLTTLDEPYPHYGIQTTRSYIQAHRPTAVNFMKAILEAIARILDDPEGSKAILARHLGMDEIDDAALLEEAYQVHYVRILRKKPFPTVESIQTVLEQLIQENPNASKIQPEDVIDDSILRELDENGFIDALYPAR